MPPKTTPKRTATSGSDADNLGASPRKEVRTEEDNMKASPSKKARTSQASAKTSPSKKTQPGKTSKGPVQGQVTEDANFVFFYRTECTFSQFHPSKFKDENGRQFNCMEQYMHYHKALTFKDEKMAKAIMSTSDPKQQKKYGRKVENFDKDVWARKSMEVVREGSKLKYNQNPTMKKELLATFPKTLVEASPRDRLWGVGLSVKNAKIHDPKTWRGKNLLGKVLTEVRDSLMKEHKKEKSENE